MEYYAAMKRNQKALYVHRAMAEVKKVKGRTEFRICCHWCKI